MAFSNDLTQTLIIGAGVAASATARTVVGARWKAATGQRGKS
jgi:hypothetical protein